MTRRVPGSRWMGSLLLCLAALTAAPPPAGAAPLATQPADFLQPGTQPAPALDNFIPARPACAGCHGTAPPGETLPHDAWAASMMAQSARDPIVRAAAAIANQDATGSAETCIRCHAPAGWLAGRSAGADFGALLAGDLDGVSCHVCHRMLDPIGRADAPAEDAAILALLDAATTRPAGTCRTAPLQPCVTDAACAAAGPCDVDAGQGRFVVDPGDNRRGPFTVPFAPHPTIASPFHRRADVCAPCHDVSTPTYTGAAGGTYVLNALGAPHPTQRPHDMFPEQRTFSEWRASAFATGGVVFPDGRFGGALTATLPNTVAVSTCQDCHMPDAQAAGCTTGSPRPDLPTHGFAGANTWVLGAVLAEYGAASGLSEASIQSAHGRVAAMLAAAADLEVTQTGTTLRVRVVNQSGHKLPTGYPEGRRMWLNARFFEDGATEPVAEDGAYDPVTATLDLAHTTKVYEARQTIDAAVAGAVGLAPGTPFHLVLNNTVAFDNRIPPRGFGNADFAAAGAAPVGAVYADGQHWDDTDYALPPRATRAEVALHYQTTTREYAEFLRDTAGDATGANAWARWEAAGRSAPVVMRRVVVDLVPLCGAGASPCCGRPAGTACDDGDPCTSDEVCGGELCAGTAPGFDGARCEVARLQSPGPCPTALPRKLGRFVNARAQKAGRLIEKAGRRAAEAPDAARRLLDKAARALAPVPERTTAAVSAKRPAKRVTAACAETVSGVVTAATALLEALP